MHGLEGSWALILGASSGFGAATARALAGRGMNIVETNWLKLEIHPDPKYLLPDPVETLEAAAELVKLGFIVLPYTPCRSGAVQAARRSRCCCCNAARFAHCK